MDIFIGRFHPLVVHLPIGFIVLAFLCESLCHFFSSLKEIRKYVPLMYLLSFIAGLLSIASGLILSDSGAYGGSTLSTHKWLGIVVTLTALGLAIIKRKPTAIAPKASYGLSVVLLLLVSLTGHFGGLLTHGDDYLYEHAPGWVQTLAGFKPHDAAAALAAQPPDSVQVYVDLVRPILEARCVQCHNTEEAAGGFSAQGYATLFEEAESGTPVVPGSLASSEMYRRITLPASSAKFMPPSGHPLSYTELGILRYWIETGADSLSHFDYASMDRELVRLVKRDYSLDYSPRPYYEKVAADSLSPELLEQVAAAGYAARYLGGVNFLLDVEYTGDTLEETTSNSLGPVSGNVTFLDLSDVVIRDTAMAILKELRHLTRLDLHGARFSDNIFKDFDRLEHLEVLNVYNTEIGEEGLMNALSSPSLKRVYLWQTGLTPEVIDQAASRYPAITFDRGLSLVAPDTTASSGAP